MTRLPVELWLNVLKDCSLLQLSNVWLTCQMLKWAVSVELKRKIEVGLRQGKSMIFLQLSLERRLRALLKHPLSLRNPSFWTRSLFQQSRDVVSQDGHLIFDDQ